MDALMQHKRNHGDGLLAYYKPTSAPTAIREVLMKKCDRLLREKFGHSGYKGKQKEIIEAAISGSDVFVLAPTGMGKSLCFQLPSIVSECGVSVVVSPLLALMKNQVASLREKGVAAVSLTSDTSKKDKAKIFTDLSSPRPKIRLLYTTPERLCTQDVTQLLAMVYKNGFLNRLVVDEAHCISEWGHDFREEYRKLGTFRDNFPRVPVMALTATATDNVRDDIISSLKMIEDRLYTAIHPSNRANLFYEIRYTSGEDSLARKADIFEFISTLYKRRGSPSCGIIYCRLRQMCDELSHFLTAKGLKARPYHRGIKLLELDETLKGWQAGGTEKGNIDVVCATVAFGMGIDKSDVRYIIHYDLPKSFEGYYQETGRAGRDGLPSRCVLYYSREDAWRVRSLLSRSRAKRQDAARVIGGPEPSQRTGDSFQGLADYAEDDTICRHVLICKYFGETIDTADKEMMKSLCDKMCDICRYPAKVRQRKANLSSIDASAWKDDGYEDEDELADYFQPPSLVDHSFQTAREVEASRPLVSHNLNIGAKPSGPVGFQSAKRACDDGALPPDSKRMKHNTSKPPAPLVTRAYSSASSLKKPFKIPFKTPLKIGSTTAEANPQPCNIDNGGASDVEMSNTAEELRESNNESIESLKQPTAQCPPPGFNVELEASFSQKIPLSVRMKAFGSIRQVLYQVMDNGGYCNKLQEFATALPTNTEARTSVLANAAKAIEFCAQTMSATQPGYDDRVNQKLSAIRRLGAMGEANEDEDEMEVVHAVKEALDEWTM
ncbi:P-loop containing nucleoside triphosphate hydrolase protein [Pisolithus marmoratus]|nr:P-loop containing nucleoside triphosphate hydrolase protein [Pisolithus marmoratus]